MPEYDNAAVAAILDDFAALLEIAGEDRYRFLSYHAAAQAVRAWDERITVTARDGRLTAIPSVGPKLAVAITSILARGTFAEYEELTKRIPGTLTQLTRVQGLGPKRVRTLFEDLGIATLDDLEDAIAAGRLAGQAGFGAKTLAAIEDGIRRCRELSARILLASAKPLADGLVAALRETPGVGDASEVGSLRRMRETVGDITILVAASDASSVLGALNDLPAVTQVTPVGADATELATTSGHAVLIRVTGPESWGAALQQLTGSARHNDRLRQIAGQQGLELSAAGVFRRSDGQRVPAPREADVYALLGMSTVPPEIREDLGEIELALAGQTPLLIGSADIRGDLHSHSTATDGRSTVEQNRARAAELGYEYFACSDHAYTLRMVGGLDERQLEEQWALIDDLNARDDGGPRVLKAIELNIDDEGGVDYPEEVLARFDLCIASLHGGFAQPRAKATRRILRAMENPYVDIIGHPTGRLLGRRDPFDLDMEAIVAAAAETGTALELNAHPERLDLNDEHLRMARASGVKIAINTDAHEAVQMSHMRWGVATARRGWLEPADVLNAQPLPVLLSLLKRNRAAGR